MRGDAKLLRGLGDHLCSLVVHPQRGVIVLIDEHLKCLEQTENSLLADLAATADAIFLRAHVQQRIADQLFPADQDAGRLRPANILAATESHHVEAYRWTI